MILYDYQSKSIKLVMPSPIIYAQDFETLLFLDFRVLQIGNSRDALGRGSEDQNRIYSAPIVEPFVVPSLTVLCWNPQGSNNLLKALRTCTWCT